MTNNSLAAYNHILRTGKLRRQELDIVAALRIAGKPLTLHDIADIMKVTPNVISGRFRPMVDAGILKITGSEKVPGRRSRTLYWLVYPEIKQQFKPGMRW